MAAPFLLPGLADQVLNGHTLAAVQHHIIRVFLNLRHIQDADEVVMDHDPLRPVLSLALGLIHVDTLYKLMQDGGRQRFHLHELPNRLQKLILAVSPIIFLVALTLQLCDVLFELLLFLIVPLGHFHKTLIGQLARKGVIFKDPTSGPYDLDGNAISWYKGWQTADEYLSGNVREKLSIAKLAAENDPTFQDNVQALEQVQPADLTASEISVRLGATWLPPEIVEHFMFELFSTPNYCQWKMTNT